MTANIIPTLRYRNAPRMLEWLVEAFGFKRHAVHEDGKGGIAHAQLTLGNGMIMLASGARRRIRKIPEDASRTRRHDAKPLHHRGGCRRDLRARRCEWSKGRHAHSRSGLWRTCLQLPRSGRPFVEFWHLRSMEDGLVFRPSGVATRTGQRRPEASRQARTTSSHKRDDRCEC